MAAAALAAEAAQMTALADAATAAAVAQEMALADAATAAEAAKMMALADAATAAEAAKMMALAEAATAAEAAKMMALAEAATAADAALETALAEAATLAGEDKAEALRLAEAAHMTALANAKTAADDAQAMALAAAKTAADDAQAMALAAAKTAADDAQAMALAAAKTAADAKLMAANDGLVAALQDRGLTPASDTMSVEDQIATNTAALQAELVLITDERNTAQDALFAAGVEKAILEANAAMQTYARLLVTYESIDADAGTAAGLVTAANRAKTEADEALAAAQAGDDVVLTARAQRAVNQADAVVLTADAQLAEAKTTASAMPYAMAILKQAPAPAGLAASAKRTDNEVEVSVTSDPDKMLIAKVITSVEDDGWYRANVVNEDGDQTATVYTNIENTMMKFNDVHTSILNSAITAVGATTGILTLFEGTTANNGNAAEFTALNKYVSAPNFPGVNEGEQKFIFATGAEKKFDGTFDGVPGEYRCTSGTECTATANSKGELIKLTSGDDGSWTFIPAYLGEDGVSDPADSTAGEAAREDDLPVPKVAIDDEEYEHFGWWTMVKDDGEVAFQTFFGGTDMAGYSGTTNDLVGTAKYEGPSAGRYAVKTFNSNSTLDSIRDGEFTATAKLTASFGGTAIAEDDAFSIKGEVTDFANENDDDLAGWSVVLKATSFLGGNVFPTVNNTDEDEGDVGGGVGGSPVTSGSWSGSFFGTPDPGADGDGLITDDYPLSVVGEFNAHSSHGHVAGGFGADVVKQ